jgi:hypothetical protein
MLAVFFIAGMILSGSLAYAGLVSGSLKLSKETTLTGKTAKTSGIACLVVMLILLGLAAWAIYMMTVKPR